MSYIALFLLALALTALAVWMLRRYQPGASIRYYAAFLLGLALIAMLHGMISLFIDGPVELLTMFDKFGYVSGVFTFSMLLLFSFHYPIPSAATPQRSELLWIVPLAFFIPYLLFSDMAIKSVMAVNGGLRESYGPGFFIFPAFVLVYVAWAIINLINKLGFTVGRELQNTRLFILVLICSAIVGFVFDVLYPFLGSVRYPAGVYAGGALFGLSVFIVTRK